MSLTCEYSATTVRPAQVILDAIIHENLADLDLSSADIRRALPKLRQFHLHKKSLDYVPNPKSRAFAYRAKAKKLCDQLANNEIALTPEAYAWVVHKQHATILALSPQTVFSNLNGLVEGLRIRGVTIPDDSKKLGQLKGLQRRTVNLGDIVNAALQQPNLFRGQPVTFLGNLDRAVALFQQLCFVVNIKEDGCEAFKTRKYGLNIDLDTYVIMALKHPQLFCQDPATIAHHLHLLQTMVRAGILKQGSADNPFGPLVQCLVRTPAYLSLESENMLLRLVADAFDRADPATPAGDAEFLSKPNTFMALHRRRKVLEAKVITRLQDTALAAAVDVPPCSKNLRNAGQDELAEAGLLKFYKPRKASAALAP